MKRFAPCRKACGEASPLSWRRQTVKNYSRLGGEMIRSGGWSDWFSESGRLGTRGSLFLVTLLVLCHSARAAAMILPLFSAALLWSITLVTLTLGRTRTVTWLPKQILL